MSTFSYSVHRNTFILLHTEYVSMPFHQCSLTFTIKQYPSMKETQFNTEDVPYVISFRPVSDQV